MMTFMLIGVGVVALLLWRVLHKAQAYDKDQKAKLKRRTTRS